MKKWSIRKKSVNDEIIANEPRPVKNRSIKHLFKMNFLPITFLLYAVVIIAVVLLFMGGIADNKTNVEPNNGSTSGNTVTMTAQQFVNDMTYSVEMIEELTQIILDFSSLNEGDSLILKDTISNISYDTIFGDETSIRFDVEEYTIMGFQIKEIVFTFEGDLTNKFKKGDAVEITLTIKHFAYVDEFKSFDSEVFLEGWDQQLFIDRSIQQLPGDVIQLI